jgi:hypothetical protein
MNVSLKRKYIDKILHKVKLDSLKLEHSKETQQLKNNHA